MDKTEIVEMLEKHIGDYSRQKIEIYEDQKKHPSIDFSFQLENLEIMINNNLEMIKKMGK